MDEFNPGMICGVIPRNARRTPCSRQFLPSLKSSGSSRTPAMRLDLRAVNPGLVASCRVIKNALSEHAPPMATKIGYTCVRTRACDAIARSRAVSLVCVQTQGDSFTPLDRSFHRDGPRARSSVVKTSASVASRSYLWS
eukprot:CAMPEP_0174578902 /NCGR_PEP_ID=MMETSP0929-20130131/1215_1 /TAXON_ID=548131 ORGANISM="Ostreococcus mediterraneus, Strain clade-D-RCC2572" /NCGR_SAMPLE_ID=MMETSP0929 /ASSEMBLY_ACC=CAM_ASM_000573 /LENGTH=138 /DNA_ID=CAMNT_0015760173 /DNA_START=157 /DNA_END=573 /DNA_ORIENTATION=-